MESLHVLLVAFDAELAYERCGTYAVNSVSRLKGLYHQIGVRALRYRSLLNIESMQERVVEWGVVNVLNKDAKPMLTASFKMLDSVHEG